MVTITLRVLSRPDTEHLSTIFQSLGLDYDERVLPSIGNEVLKSIVAQFDAAELITQREVVSILGHSSCCWCMVPSGLLVPVHRGHWIGGVPPCMDISHGTANVGLWLTKPRIFVGPIGIVEDS